MFNSHLPTDNPQQTKKIDHIDHNVNEIINLTHKKIKELSLKKQDLSSASSHLKGQSQIINTEILNQTKEAKEKESIIERLIEEFNQIGEELIELEKEFEVTRREYSLKEEEMKGVSLFITNEKTMANEKSKVESMSKKEEVQIEMSKLKEIQKENKALDEQCYHSKREAYISQIEYYEVMKNEEKRNMRAVRGIDIVNKVYDLKEKNFLNEEKIESG